MDLILEAIDEALKKKGLSDAAASKLAVGNPSLIKNFRAPSAAGKRYNAVALQKLADVLDLEFYFGPRRINVSAAEGAAGHSLKRAVFSAAALPRRGFAKCGVDGWGEDGPSEESLPKPEGFDDPDAFYVTALGQSMIPEGIWPGAFCLVSPATKPKPGDRVWIRDTNRKVAMKRLVEYTDRGVKLRGWQNVEDGSQRSYDEERFTAGIDAMHPVVAVYDRAPSSGKAEFVPDPMVDPQIFGSDPDVIAEFAEKGFGILRRHESQPPLPNQGDLEALALPLDWLENNGIDPGRACLVAPEDDGMLPTINRSSTLIVNQAVRTPGRGHACALIDGNRIIIRRVEEVSGQLILLTDNPNVPTRIVEKRDGGIQILGRVVWQIGPVITSGAGL
jgi:phage repressor protein C with HTH and peptisase S24 domain